MATTLNLGIPLVDASQAQKEVTINEAFRAFDAIFRGTVEDKDLATPPTNAIAGAVYIVAASATGDWAGHSNALAYYDQIWRFVTPSNGMRVWVRDEVQHYLFNGSSWISQASGRIGGFSPLQGTSIRSWWNFSDYASLTLVSGNRVSVALDRSGNSNSAAQTGGAKPSYGSSYFNDAAPGVAFNVPGNFNAGDNSSLRNIFSGGGTVVVSLIITGSGTNGTIFSKTIDGFATSGYALTCYGSGNSVTMRFTVGATTTQGNWDVTDPLSLNTPYVIELSYNSSTPGTAPVIRINGVLKALTVVATAAGTAASDAGGSFILGNNADGGLQPFLGVINQCVVFNAVQSSSFMTQLRSYLGALGNIATVPLYLLCGQSNMVGNATLDTADYGYDAAIVDYELPRIWDGGQFSPLVSGVNNLALDAISIGPEIAFGITQSAVLKQSAYLIKFAVGATNLASDWAPTTGTQWVAMRAVIDAAIPAIAASGKLPVVMAYLWAQGETDGQNSTNATAYQTNLTNFATAIESTALANYARSPQYAFVISGLPNQSLTTIPYAATIRTAQQNVGALTNRLYIDTLDLPLNADQVHLNARGAITLGQRFAAVMNNSLIRLVRNFKPADLKIPDYRYQIAQTYSGSITWTGTTSPSGTTNHSYVWTRVGKQVTLKIWLNYATAGSALTQVAMDLPVDLPVPYVPAGFSGASSVLYSGEGRVGTTTTAVPTAAYAFLRRNAANSNYECVISVASISPKVASLTIIYDTI